MKKIFTLFTAATVTLTTFAAATPAEWESADDAMNVALGKTVYVSEQHSGDRANLVNGVLEGYNAFQLRKSNEQPVEWIVIDLGAVYDVSKISVSVAGDRRMHKFGIYTAGVQNIAVEYSDGNDAIQNWDLVAEVTDDDYESHDLATFTYATDSKAVRYIRYQVLESRDQYSSTMSEIRVAGVEIEGYYEVAGMSLLENITIQESKTADLGFGLVNAAGNNLSMDDPSKLSVESSNPEVAAVSIVNGRVLVKGIAGGEAVVTVTYGEYTKTCNVTVTGREDFEVKINEFNSGAGKVTASCADLSKITKGSDVTIKFEPNTANGYYLCGLKIDGKNVENVDPYGYELTIEKIDKDYDVVVTFEKRYVITVNYSGKVGSIRGNNGEDLTKVAMLVRTDGEGGIGSFTVSPIFVHHENIQNECNKNDLSDGVWYCLHLASDLNKVTLNGEVLGDNGSFTFSNEMLNKTGNYEVSLQKHGGDRPFWSFNFSHVHENMTFDIAMSSPHVDFTLNAGENGAVTTESNLENVEIGSDVTLNIKPDEGFVINCVKVNGINQTISDPDGMDLVISAITDATTVEVVFAVKQFTISTRVSSTHIGSGSVTLALNEEEPTVAPLSKKVDWASNVKLVATPAEGCYVAFLSVNDEEVADFDKSEAVVTLNDVKADYNVLVGFDYYTFKVSATCGENGKVEAAEGVDPEAVIYGTSAKFVITPDEGYKVASIKVDGVEVENFDQAGGEFTVNDVKADATVEVTFDHLTFKVSATCGENGKIAAAEGVDLEAVVYGTSVKFVITPDEGYIVAFVKVDGVEVENFDQAGGELTIEDVKADTNIEVAFSVLSGIDSINADNASTRYFNLNGVEVTNPTSGLYIVVRDGKVTKENVK